MECGNIHPSNTLYTYNYENFLSTLDVCIVLSMYVSLFHCIHVRYAHILFRDWFDRAQREQRASAWQANSPVNRARHSKKGAPYMLESNKGGWLGVHIVSTQYFLLGLSCYGDCLVKMSNYQTLFKQFKACYYLEYTHIYIYIYKSYVNQF